MTKHTTSHARRGRNRLLLAAGIGLALVALPMTGCDSALEVHDPDIVTPDNLQDDLGLTTLRNGALSNFNQAWSAGGWAEGGIILLSGLMTDEWAHSGTFPTRRQLDRREVQINGNATLDNLFLQLHQARADLERAAVRIDRAAPDPDADARIPEMLAYAGFTYIAFGENYCSGVPFSETVDSIMFGEPLTTAQMFERAVTYFDDALAHPAVSAEIENLARVGKGRALLSLDRAADAANAVATVPDEFAVYNWHSNTSPPRTISGTYHLNPEAGRWTIADAEGGTGLPFRTATDPRVPWSDIGLGFDNETPLYQFDVYQSREDRFPLATGLEARLIEAEAALQAGGDWLTILNDLRQDANALYGVLYPENPPSGGLAPLTDPGTAAGRTDLLFSERAFWLFNTGHRLGDLRRLIRQYGRTANQVFPTGAYFKGGSYGSDVNIPVPQPEQNNPNFAQCIDRNP
jgi:hypothetical protein